jgi:DNA-binding NtrC family response regulator
MARMQLYHWPGNVRELQHAIERACIFVAGSRIELEDLPDAIWASCEPSDFRSRQFQQTLKGFHARIFWPRSINTTATVV